MNDNELLKYRSWCIKKAHLSEGTATIYCNNLSQTQSFTLNDTYEKIFTIINNRVVNNPTRCTHVSYIKYLKSNEISFEKKKFANMLIMDIADMMLGKNRKLTIDDIKDKVLTKEEVTKLYNFIYNLKSKTGKYRITTLYNNMLRLHNLLYFRILYESAGRPMEVKQYDWQMIDCKNKQIHVPKSLTKRNRSRDAEISDNTVALLQDYKKLQMKEFKKLKPLFFNFKTYKSINTFAKYVGKQCIGRDITSYFFKHSFMTHKAVDAIKKGVHIAIVREDLKNYVRHNSTTTTDIYIALAQQYQQERLLEKYGEVPQ